MAQWYQKRFLPPDRADGKLFYRDLSPGTVRDGVGRAITLPGVRRRGPRSCFAEQDLYTRFLGTEPSTEVERIFLGKVDTQGKAAVEAFCDFSVANALVHYDALLEFIGTQKLRTPKGLAWIATQAESRDQDTILQLMVRNRAMYHAIWSECVWLIADASRSSTKFIISDHPVTTYNRACGPRSDWCRGVNDPDLTFSATQTIFPLSLDKVLLLTNLTWARNPYQNPLARRPNPTLNRIGIFKAMRVQGDRHLTEAEVREINFIVRNRARRYVAAAEREWLYPENHVSKSDWARYGDGYLLMPDPRGLHMGGTVYMMSGDGRHYAADEYGRTPVEQGFETRDALVDESITLYRFKGEFARLYGPRRRGRITEEPEAEPETDDDEFHAYHLSLEAENRKLMKGVRNWS